MGSVLADLLLSRTEPLVVDYHNITPAKFFDEWDPPILHAVEWGRNQMARRARVAASASPTPSSTGPRSPRTATGQRRSRRSSSTSQGFDREIDERVLAELEQGKQEGGADWLFVGRVTPNKCQHDVVKAFAAYRTLHDPNARLHIVGGVASEPYAAALRGRSCASSGSATASP